MDRLFAALDLPEKYTCSQGTVSTGMEAISKTRNTGTTEHRNTEHRNTRTASFRNTGTLKILNLLKIREKKYRGV